MTYQIFNRTFFLWASAIAVASFIVNPRAALIQRVNTMNEAYIDCLRDENCKDSKAIAEAREYYKILAQLYPDYGRGAEMEGVCYLLLKKDGLAINKFQEAIKHNPDLFWVSFELGRAFYRRGEYSQALKYFQEIIMQDNNTLLRKAILSSFRQFPDKERGELMIGLIDFVTEIKLKSYQMTIGCFVHQGNLTQAKSIVSQGLNNQQFGQNEFFILANRSLGEEDSSKEMLRWIDAIAYSKPTFHPWGHVIQPLKEILYQ